MSKLHFLHVSIDALRFFFYRSKFLSRALAVYCLAQLPDSKPSLNQDPASPHSPAVRQIVRFTPHSPGVAPPREPQDPQSSPQSSSIEIRPSAEAVKAMQGLESLLSNKQYAELKGDIEQSIRMIRDSANSLHNAVEVCGALVGELYTQRYLQSITE